MTRVYAVLFGTLWLDYESEEAAKSSLAPTMALEVLGVSEWDGQGRANQYPNGFLIVTHTGQEYYLSAATTEERNACVLQIRVGLECHFANVELNPYKPGKHIQQRPPVVGNIICPKTRAPMGPILPDTHVYKNNRKGSREEEAVANEWYLESVQNGRITANPPFESPISQLCLCCGRGYSSPSMVESVGPPVMQLGCETPEIMCGSCLAAQMAILWLKSLNYAHVGALHEMTPEISANPQRCKATFAMFRRKSTRLDMAAALWEGGDITSAEFHELRQVDEDYRREIVLEEAERLKHAVDALGDDIQTILSLLLNPTATSAGGAIAYHYVILKLLAVADNEPLLIDFYWSQLIQVHLQAAAINTPEFISKVDEIQQALLVLSLKYPQLGTKLAWALVSSLSDYRDRDAGNGKICAAQYAACICLLLQLEHILTGNMSSIYSTITSSSPDYCASLAHVLNCAEHQQQEIAFEMSVLFLSRRRLQESYDRELRIRVSRRGLADQQGLRSPSRVSFTVSASVPGSTGANDKNSCVSLLNHLGIGRIDPDRDVDSPRNGGWHGLAVQLNFVDRLTTLVESLRFIERKQRTTQLQEALHAWNKEGDEATLSARGLIYPGFHSVPSLGWDPVGAAGEPLYRITRILPEYCRVFRTKARAPSMIVCEVMREDVHNALTREPHLAASDSDSTVSMVGGSSSSNRNRTRSYDLASHLHGNTETLARINAGSQSDVGDSSGNVSFNLKDNDKELQALQVAGLTRSHDDGKESTPGRDSDVAEVVGELVDSSIGDLVQAIGKIQLQQAEIQPEQKQEPEPPAPVVSPVTRRDSLSNRSANVVGAPAAVGSQKPVTRRMSGNLLSKNRVPDGTSFQALLTRASSEELQLHTLPALESSPLSSATPRLSISASSAAATVAATVAASATAAEAQSPLTSPGVLIGRTPRNSTVGGTIDWERYSDSSADEPVIVKVDSDSEVEPSAEIGTASALSLAIPSPTEAPADAATPLSLFAVSSRFPAVAVSLSPVPAAPKAASPTAEVVLTAARRLLLAGKIDEEEYRMLLLSDHMYKEEEARVHEAQIATRVEAVFGPSWKTLCDKELAHWGMDSDEDEESTTKEDVPNQRLLQEQYAIDGTSSALSVSQSTAQGSVATAMSVAARPQVPVLPVNADLDDQWPPVDLRCYIVKSNDDLRQEMAVLQLMCLCREIFTRVGLSEQQLHLHPYRIVGTGPTTGIVEVLTDTMSLDALKKTADFTSLNDHFYRVYGTKEEQRELLEAAERGSDDRSPRLASVRGNSRLDQAKRAFTASLAAYSIFTYIFAIKDRHNGNILLDQEGHIVHIDFGFLLGGAPGGVFSMEAAPFKLTEEMVKVMDGLESPLFGEFVKAFTTGFLALRSHSEIIVSALEVLSINSTFVCFAGKDRVSILDKLRSRFRHDLDVKAFVQHCIDLTVSSYAHYGSRQYDNFQWYTNGISI